MTFGYDNPNQVAVVVQVGRANAVVPAPIDREQPDVFIPGRFDNAFTVRGVPEEALAVWTVQHYGRTAIAVSSSFPVTCGPEPRPIPVEIFPLCARRTGSTYVAVFGYQNLNETTVNVPFGTANLFDRASRGHTRPTAFRPGLAPIALVVDDIPIGQAVTWSLRTFGAVDVARATVDSADCRITAGSDAPDLAIMKVAEPRRVAVGERVEYTITVTNGGPADASQVAVVDRQLGSNVRILLAT